MVKGLARTFPDARFIACFRNPTDAVPSQVSAMVKAALLIDPHADTGYWRDRLTELLKFYCSHLLAALPQMPSSGHAMVTMETLSQAPLATIEQLYRRFAYPYPTNPTGGYV
jgi:omega-hydroxy-beta-dihydromenaquinone-9 sulfotransferase